MKLKEPDERYLEFEQGAYYKFSDVYFKVTGTEIIILNTYDNPTPIAFQRIYLLMHLRTPYRQQMKKLSPAEVAKLIAKLI